MLNSREATRDEIEKTGLVHRVYLPDGSVGPRPIVLFVHGRAGDARVMWIFSKALEGIRPIIVAPQAPNADPLGGFSWWDVAHPADSESPLPSQTKHEQLVRPLEQLKSFLTRAALLYGGDLSQAYAAGFSQGAACVGSLSVREPELFRGVAMLSGFLPRVLQEEMKADPVRLGACRYFIGHGIKDEVIPFARAEETAQILTECGASVEIHSEDVGHKTGTAGIRALRAWFAALMQ